MNWRLWVRMLTGLLALLCFIVVGIMYSKLSFIDTPYLYGGLLLLLPTIFLKSK